MQIDYNDYFCYQFLNFKKVKISNLNCVEQNADLILNRVFREINGNRQILRWKYPSSQPHKHRHLCKYQLMLLATCAWE